MDIVTDIQPITTFRNHATEFLADIEATRRPLILTVNGRAAAVARDAETCQRLLDLAAQGAAAEGIRQGIEDLDAERVRPAGEVFADLRARHGMTG